MLKKMHSYCVACLLVFWSLSAVAATDKPEYQIEKMKDNIYRFTAGHYRSVFMVSDSGIIVTDPINSDAATYLKAELKKRFNKPIRYVIYSHNHVYHTQGGNVFADKGVDIVAQKYAAEDLQMTKSPTAMPDITFDDQLRIALDQNYVDLQYHGVNNGRGSVSMRFMPANVVFVVDWIVIGRMPYKNLMGYDIQGMIDSTQDILDMPAFDLFIGGHAEAGNREDIQFYQDYLKDLYAAVRDGMLKGKNLEQLQQEIKLPKYSKLKMYQEWLPLNVEGVYNTLKNMSYFEFREDLKR